MIYIIFKYNDLIKTKTISNEMVLPIKNSLFIRRNQDNIYFR